MDVLLEQQLHVECAFDGIGPVGCDFLEPHSAIQFDRILHGRCNCVQAHTLVADLARFGDYPVHQHPPQSFPAKIGAHVEPLHFANFVFESAQPDAASWLAATAREKELPGGRSVRSWQGSEFLIETLKTQAEAERLRVFEEEGADLLDVFGKNRSNQFDVIGEGSHHRNRQ